MKTLIVSKTHMQNAACVGGILLDTNRSVRLLQHDGRNHSPDTDFQIGQIWEIEYQERKDKIPPHIEDILTNKRTFIGDQNNLKQFLLQQVKPWKGGIDVLFDHLVRFTWNGHGYISVSSGIPKVSTGYWLSDKTLACDKSEPGKTRYKYDNTKSITYVGYSTQIDMIPVGTLVRVSLARWWKPYESEMEDRCYLQLSGWYL